LLHASHILEGSVRRAGCSLRIVAQLIDAATDGNLWAERYAGTVEDVFEMQEKVARSIATALQVKLSTGEQQRLATRPANQEAHEAYLKGLFHFYRITAGHFDRAQSYFEFALEKDPDYAPAHAGIASVWLLRADSGFVTSREAVPKATSAVVKALELDETLAEGHVTLANIMALHNWDWAAAEREFRRAIELNPNSADAHFMYADFLISMKRTPEWEVEIRRVLELDPVNPFFQCFYGWELVYVHRCDEAIGQLKKALASDSNFTSAHMGLWGAYYRKGTWGAALEEAAGFFASLGDAEVEDALRRVPVAGDYRGAMRGAAEVLAERSKQRHVPGVRVARLYAHAGEVDDAVGWLQRAYADRETPLMHLSVAWDWDVLRGDPRFQDLLRRLGLPQ
jgi:tetratricopeptide (TPR) repeat protein